MNVHQRTLVQHSRIAAAGALSAAVVSTSLAMPSAFAAPEGELWDLVNNQHVSAGCARYTHSTLLDSVALDNAKDLVNNGRVMARTDVTLNNVGYNATSLGEMDYIMTDGTGSPQNALNFWLNNPTAAIFPNCEMLDLATAVWIVGNKWAAVALTARPPGAGVPTRPTTAPPPPAQPPAPSPGPQP